MIFIKGTNIRIKRPNGIVVVQTVTQEWPNVWCIYRLASILAFEADAVINNILFLFSEFVRMKLCMDRKKAIIMGDTVNIRLTAEDKIHLQQRMDETGKKATEVFKSAIYFTEIDADLVDEIISNIGNYASEKNWEGVKEEVHRYVLYRTQK